MIILSGIVWSISLLIIGGKETYIGELGISFLPYIGAVTLIFLCYWLFVLGKQLYTRNLNCRKHTWKSAIFVLLFAVLLGMSLGTIKRFYQSEQRQEQNLEAPIKVLFSNIYKGNYDFEGIKNTILTEQPDVVMFVEFGEKHKEALQDFFDEHYPYMNTTVGSKIFIGRVVFSKYPITNLADDFPQSSWRYGYFKIEKADQPYYFYEIHTSAPVSKNLFEYRNHQLEQVSSDFLTHHQKGRTEDAKIVMVGDFNTSPRSAYYQQFAQTLSGALINQTKNFPLLFTRNLSKMVEIHEDLDKIPHQIRKMIASVPLLWSHIDHVFTSPTVKISNLKTIQIPGSDHRGYVFEIE